MKTPFPRGREPCAYSQVLGQAEDDSGHSRGANTTGQVCLLDLVYQNLASVPILFSVPLRITGGRRLRTTFPRCPYS